jgi:hypothetical protein
MSMYSRRYRERDSYGTTYVATSFMGFDAELQIEHIVTSWGYPTTWDEPGEGPEFEIENITLVVYGEDGPGPECKLTGAQFEHFYYDADINNAVSENIYSD